MRTLLAHNLAHPACSNILHVFRTIGRNSSADPRLLLGSRIRFAPPAIPLDSDSRTRTRSPARARARTLFPHTHAPRSCLLTGALNLTRSARVHHSGPTDRMGPRTGNASAPAPDRTPLSPWTGRSAWLARPEALGARSRTRGHGSTRTARPPSSPVHACIALSQYGPREPQSRGEWRRSGGTKRPTVRIQGDPEPA